MANMKSMSPSQVILLLAATILLTMLVNSMATDAAAGGRGNKFCKATDAGAEMALCVKLVNGATTWDEALANTVRAIGAELKKDQPMFDKIPRYLPRQLKPVSKSSILSTCKEAHDSVVYGVRMVLENIRTGDPQGSIDSELSATLSALSDCTDGMDEFGVEDPDIVRVRDIVQKYASISLAISSLKKT